MLTCVGEEPTAKLFTLFRNYPVLGESISPWVCKSPKCQNRRKLKNPHAERGWQRAVEVECSRDSLQDRVPAERP